MKSLFDQTSLAGMRLKNRFVRSATYDGFADKSGHMTEELFQVYEDLAKGGVGTIITGLTYVSDLEEPLPRQMGIYDDSFIAEYEKLTKMCHQHDTRIIMQLVCMGSQTSRTDGKAMWGPSAVEDLRYKTTPQEMTVQDIHFVQMAFADAALRAKQAGFDGVQLHGAHGYLLSKFLTPYYNRRTDDYGGSIGNRAKILLETYEVIREKVGPDYPVLVKINCDDFMEQGMSFADCRYICETLARMGIGAIEISGGIGSSRPNEGTIRMIKTAEQESYFQPYAVEIARQISVPVILVGGNREFASLTEILNQTELEYFALCRPLIRESGLINRWQKGDRGQAKCVSCNQCFRIGGTTCVFNGRQKASART